ncbi:acyl carrier protein [Eubacterium saphenum ATCC 49989]|nr:acyl carrier protein [Eubacterium saphenum ATCC 49989]
MVFEKIRKIISEQVDIEEEKITMETSLLKDLEADSLEAVEILMEISDEFGIEISDEEAEKFQTVGDIVEYVEHHID